MHKGKLILYWHLTEVDRIPISILTWEGLTLKVEWYKKYMKVGNKIEYTVTVEFDETTTIKKAPMDKIEAIIY